MKIASQVEYNFSDERAKKMSARDFICQYLDSSHVDIVMQCAYDLNLTTEEATAYAMAMFNSIQDIFYFHHNLELGEISVTTVRDNGDVTNVADRKKIFSFREALKEPYLSNRSKNVVRVVSYLKKQSNNKKRLVEGIQIENPEVYFRKKKKMQEANKKRWAKKSYAKVKRIKKKAAKRWAWANESQ